MHIGRNLPIGHSDGGTLCFFFFHRLEDVAAS